MAETPETPNEETAPEPVEDKMDAPVAPVNLKDEGMQFLDHLGEAGVDGVKALGTSFLTRGVRVLSGIVNDITGKDEKKD